MNGREEAYNTGFVGKDKGEAHLHNALLPVLCSGGRGLKHLFIPQRSYGMRDGRYRMRVEGVKRNACITSAVGKEIL